MTRSALLLSGVTAVLFGLLSAQKCAHARIIAARLATMSLRRYAASVRSSSLCASTSSASSRG